MSFVAIINSQLIPTARQLIRRAFLSFSTAYFFGQTQDRGGSPARLFPKTMNNGDAWPTTTRGNRVVSGWSTLNVISQSCDISVPHSIACGHNIHQQLQQQYLAPHSITCGHSTHRSASPTAMISRITIHYICPCHTSASPTAIMFHKKNSTANDVSYHIPSVWSYNNIAFGRSISNCECNDVSYHNPLHVFIPCISNSTWNGILFRNPLYAVMVHQPVTPTAMMSCTTLHVCVCGDCLVCDTRRYLYLAWLLY